MEQEIKKNKLGKLKLIIVVGVLIYTIFTFANQQTLLAEQLKRSDDLAVRQAELERDLDFKKNELNYIGTDAYIEQQARMRLGWLYPDEIKYVENSNVSQADLSDSQSSSDNN